METAVEFTWFAGMAISQKQKSIQSLHEAAKRRLGDVPILEISSKSPDPLGVRLSAFNLTFPLVGRNVSVEVSTRHDEGRLGGRLKLCETCSGFPTAKWSVRQGGMLKY